MEHQAPALDALAAARLVDELGREAVGLDVVGWRYREPYAMKSTFITLVLDDGADPHVIETRVTHTKKSHSAFDG